MREIRFRGKRIDNGEWVEGFFSRWKDGARTSSVILEFKEGLAKNDMIKWYVDPETVGQFTGLSDKEGEDIYEGDVVVPYEPTKNGIHRMPVEWSDGNGWWTINAGYHGHYGRLSKFTDGTTSCRCEIIGNIHDNKELLKETSC